jgi:hypothetical protein
LRSVQAINMEESPAGIIAVRTSRKIGSVRNGMPSRDGSDSSTG